MRLKGCHGRIAVATPHDAAYRRTTTRLGAALLVFLALFVGFDLLVDAILPLFVWHVSVAGLAVVGELLDSATYLLSFMLPVLLLRYITPPAEYCPMALSPVLPRRFWLILPAGMATIYTFAIFNSVLMRLLGWQVKMGSSPIIWAEPMPVYKGILLLIASVLVPAFCEELLFRGAILSALRPYGRTVAVLGSAVLFGLMHGTPGQLFYTTAAGVVLALVALESGSIWCSVLLHVFNNLFAVVETILQEQLAANTAILVYCILEILLIGGGLICLTVLVRQRSAELKKSAREIGVLPSHPVRGFLSPLMLAFILLSLGQIVFLIVLTYL